jgi:hypothetical protein
MRTPVLRGGDVGGGRDHHEQLLTLVALIDLQMGAVDRASRREEEPLVDLRDQG